MRQRFLFCQWRCAGPTQRRDVHEHEHGLQKNSTVLYNPCSYAACPNGARAEKHMQRKTVIRTALLPSRVRHEDNGQLASPRD